MGQFFRRLYGQDLTKKEIFCKIYGYNKQLCCQLRQIVKHIIL